MDLSVLCDSTVGTSEHTRCDVSLDEGTGYAAEHLCRWKASPSLRTDRLQWLQSLLPPWDFWGPGMSAYMTCGMMAIDTVLDRAIQVGHEIA